MKITLHLLFIYLLETHHGEVRDPLTNKLRPDVEQDVAPYRERHCQAVPVLPYLPSEVKPPVRLQR